MYGIQNAKICLYQAVPTDPTGRVNVLDLTASLEGAMLGEGKTQSGGNHSYSSVFLHVCGKEVNDRAIVCLQRSELLANS